MGNGYFTLLGPPEVRHADQVLHNGLLYESEREGKGRRSMTDGRYVFAHAKIRAVVSAEAGEARRSIFHRRAATTVPPGSYRRSSS
jgi:hypothetical protein